MPPLRLEVYADWRDFAPVYSACRIEPYVEAAAGSLRRVPAEPLRSDVAVDTKRRICFTILTVEVAVMLRQRSLGFTGREPGKLQKEMVCIPVSFLVAVALGLLNLGIIFYLRETRHLPPAYVGFFVAAWQLSYILACAVLRPASTRLFPKVSIALATFAIGAFIVLMLCSKSIVLAFVFFCLGGSAVSFIWPPLVGWLSHGLEGSRLNRAISRFNTSWSLGTVFSPFLSGLLSDRAAELPVYAAVAVFLSVSLVMLATSFALPAIRRDRYRDHRGKSSPGTVDQSTLLRFPAWVGGYTVYFTFGVVLNIFPLFASEKMSLSKSLIGTLLLIQALSSSGAFYLLGRSSRWQFKARYIVGLQGAVLLAVGALLAADSVALLLPLLFVFGVLSASSYVLGIFYGVSGSARRSSRMAVHESVLCLGIVSGSSLGGLNYQRLGMSWVYWMCIAILLGGLVVQLLLMRKKNPR